MFFFFNDTATTEIYTLSLHDALPISREDEDGVVELPLPPQRAQQRPHAFVHRREGAELVAHDRSEEHTSELQSRQYLVCRLLLEKNKTTHRVSEDDNPCDNRYSAERL